MTTRLFLTGIEASGRHGASPGEKDEAQAFVVDLDVQIEVASDELTATADYRKLIEDARGVVESGSFDLLETLAQAVADRIAESPGVTAVTAIVHKPGPAARHRLQGIAAAATSGGAR